MYPMYSFVKRIGSMVDVSLARDYITHLSKFDRYQSSKGIEDAADYVQSIANDILLTNVVTERFEVGEHVKWWGFSSPIPWTPTKGILNIKHSDGEIKEIIAISYESDPFSLATYSKETPFSGLKTDLVFYPCDDFDKKTIEGKILVIPSDYYRVDDWVEKLTLANVSGFITDYFSYSDEFDGEQFRGRIELPPDSTLFAFSIMHNEMNVLLASSDRKLMAFVKIDIERISCMPVVHATILGKQVEKEIWIVSHICHPGPGVNDNASGVGCVLSVADLIKEYCNSFGPDTLEYTIRFVWGPEFLGLVALLHKLSLENDSFQLPIAVINLDMVGEDQLKCKSPFIVERHPDNPLSLINVLAEEIVREVFNETSSDFGCWDVNCFKGFSDHALFVSTHSVPGCSSVIQFCHPQDVFNHTAGDDLARLSDVELFRSITAATALSLLLSDSRLLNELDILFLTNRWCENEKNRIEKICENKYLSSTWKDCFSKYQVDKLNRVIALSKSGVLNVGDEKRNIQNNKLYWSGPLNLRYFLSNLPDKSRLMVMSNVSKNKDFLAYIFYIILNINNDKPVGEVIENMSFEFMHPITQSEKDDLINLYGHMNIFFQ